jgi:hypothetical protein
MSNIYKFGFDTSYKLFDFYMDGTLCDKNNIYDGYPPNMAPDSIIEYYPKNNDSCDDIYIYNKIIHHIADVIFKSNKNYNFNYPLLRCSGNNIIDDWCLHRYMRYILTYETNKYINSIFLETLNAQSIIEMDNLYNKLTSILLYYINIKKYKKSLLQK